MSLEPVQIVLLAGAVVLRVLAALCRGGPPNAWRRAAAALLACFGAYCAGLGAGLWLATWPVVVIATLGALAALKLPQRVFGSVLDAAVVVALIVTAFPAVGVAQAATFLAAYVGVGLVADRVAMSAPRAASIGAVLIGLTAMVMFAYVLIPVASLESLARGTVTGRASIAIPLPGKEARLPSGAALWIAREPQAGVVLFLHGADARGARQRATVPLRAAFLANGYAFASLEHPGYGASPHPRLDSGLEAWDPLPSVREALELIARQFPGQPILLVGHSLGSTMALAAREIEPRVDLVMIFGAAMPDPPERDDYWYGRFLSDRRIATPLEAGLVKAIRETYYDNGRVARSLRAGGTPVVFATFEREHANLVSQRDELYSLLPEPKSRVHVAYSDHYLDTRYLGRGLVVGRPAVAQHLAADLRGWIEAATAAAGQNGYQGRREASSQ